jgi:SPP1 family predicted phage head-tail adaptor
MQPVFSKLNKRITIQDYYEKTDALGNLVKTWDDLLEVWASIIPVRGRLYEREYIAYETISHMIIIRYTPQVLPHMRIKYSNRIFIVESIINHNEESKFQILNVKENIL